ncbi:alpha-amylase family glycosyl hydrolase [Pseudooceanicola algae]|nr:alpha-amylase family glycosyl hydrolase [Pseudooceanicola algae]
MSQTGYHAGSQTENAQWWRGAVIYQVYPRSFQDSNGDGIGDLAGITQRMDHIAALGADAVWISPFFTSPMKDFGYDVSDYCDVDPMFGDLADFDALLAESRRHGLKVLIDLVLSHTSDQHPWFAESRSSRDNDKADWYVWADAKPDGTPPNNWLSIFGGSAWQWDSRRQQYYLHNFLTSQPDLNFHNADVQDALLEVARFWLDRGVNGFRLDTINFYTHDAELRDNPALDPAERTARTAPAVNPYNWQEHLFDKSRPENLLFLRRLRAVMDPYGAAAVGEVGDEQRGLEILGEYTTGDDLMNMCYAFELLSGDTPTATYVKEVMDQVETVAADGWACWAYSNHDVERHATRWKLGPEGIRAFNVLMMCLRGSVCIYQGEELGLPEADVAFEDLQDPYGIEFWPEFKGRDGCRTPMVWEAHARNAGFGTGQPWLPVSAAQAVLSVDTQIGDASSMLHHYRHAIALRQDHPVLANGSQDDMRADGDLLSFIRKNDEETLFCVFNLGAQPLVASLPEGDWINLAASLQGAQDQAGGQVALPAWGYAIFARKAG